MVSRTSLTRLAVPLCWLLLTVVANCVAFATASSPCCLPPQDLGSPTPPPPPNCMVFTTACIVTAPTNCKPISLSDTVAGGNCCHSGNLMGNCNSKDPAGNPLVGVIVVPLGVFQCTLKAGVCDCVFVPSAVVAVNCSTCTGTQCAANYACP